MISLVSVRKYLLVINGGFDSFRQVKRFKNILLVVDPSTCNESHFERALAFAGGDDARITLATTVSNGQHAGIPKKWVGKQREILSSLVRPLETPNLKIDTRVLVGRAFSEIILDVIENRRDLVVKPVEPRKPGYKLFAGTDSKLLRKCPCPVLLIRAKGSDRFRSIVAAIDIEPENSENVPLNNKILKIASFVVSRESAEFHIVHAWVLQHENYLRSSRTGLSTAEVDLIVQAEGAKRGEIISAWIDANCADPFNEAKHMCPQVHLGNGPARAEIPKCLREVNADLIVMGTVGRTGVPGLFIGNTAEDILNQIDCSVLAIKPAGFVSPVAAKIADTQQAQVRRIG